MDKAVGSETIDSGAVLSAIASRRSVKAALLENPTPNDAELQELVQVAMSAPDHGAIRPWRFRTIRGEARERLSDLFEQALLVREPNADQEAIDKIRSKPLRSPLILAVGVDVMENHPKVPVEEQVVATACAVQNLLLALHAVGWGAVLLTGWPAFDETVRLGLGFGKKDRMVGFIYIGTPSEPPREMTRPDAAQFIENWTGA